MTILALLLCCQQRMCPRSGKYRYLLVAHHSVACTGVPKPAQCGFRMTKSRSNAQEALGASNQPMATQLKYSHQTTQRCLCGAPWSQLARNLPAVIARLATTRIPFHGHTRAM